MSERDSITAWVGDLRDGDAEAAQQLWNRFFEKLVRQVEKRVQTHDCPPEIVVAEDVAVSVFESLWRGAQAGRFDDIANRDELWWLLLAMTKHKVVNHIRHATAQKRFPGKVPASLAAGADDGFSFEELVSQEPTADYTAVLEEEYIRLLNLLRDDSLRQIAVLKLEGYTNEEICQRVNIASATVTRKLRLIRDTWTLERTDDEPT